MNPENEDRLQRANRLIHVTLDQYSSSRSTYYRDPKLLTKILKKKDPFLYRLRGIETATGFLEDAFRAHESSSEETVLGNSMQALVTALSESGVGAGDIFLERDGILWVIQVKSGKDTVPGWAWPEVFRDLKRKVMTQSRVSSPGRRGVQAMLGILRGTPPSDTVETLRSDDPELNGFQYHKKVGSAFVGWMTGLNDLSRMAGTMHSRGADLALERESCQSRLRAELKDLLAAKGLDDDIESVYSLTS
jgi:hypothetical protein